ncbi:interferon-inducible GTPase 5-like protein [Labeo rohita]|uniref:Interferon-inducible GTPase 5-like protein n=1 Tax=Labeo rohita TaxID=84645 RepID=A0A498NBR1_LABRO|nr:interferon-inducible GTPase 5-like protein [Labeo rohita]
MAFIDDFYMITQEDLEGIKESISTQDLPTAVNTIKEVLEKQDLVELNIGVTGESGSGKSTFVNAFRGLGDEEEGSAKTGPVETTMEPEVYPHPKYKTVKVWDLPGIGTPNFKADEYLKLVAFERYDFFIIIASDRFRECHIQLAEEIMRMGKKFYFVRSKIDSSIAAEKRKKSFDQKKTLDIIREDCENGLRKIGIEDPVVFLISNFELGKYDLNQLQERMERELPEHKRNVLMLALPNITLEINEKKKKVLQENIGKVALLSALVATVPIPGLSVGMDVAIVTKEIETYYSTFGLDDPTLQKLCERSGKTIEEFKSLMKSPLRAGINPASILSLAGAAFLVVAENTVEYAMATLTFEDDLITPGELEHLKESISTQDLPTAIKTIKEVLEKQDLVELNIGVTGESGSGKSTFVNAFRGLGDEDEGSSKTGPVETTMEPEVYPHPKYKTVKVWDLPGIGTPNFKADEYLKQVVFERYDFFIIIASDRFRECHIQLAKEIMRMGKRFYFVRSKIDSSIAAEKRKKSFDQKKTLDTIRENCENGLRKIGVEDPVVFLISGWELGKYDLNQLQERMERELPEHKRRVLMLALPNITLEINEKKKKVLQENIGRVALLSALVATVPIPGLSVAVDAALIAKELKRYYNAFGLDDPSLQKLCRTSGKTIKEVKSLMKSPFHQGISTSSILTLLGATALLISEDVVEMFVSFIPIIGSVVAGGMSYLTVSNMLKKALNDIADDSRNVLMASLETEVTQNEEACWLLHKSPSNEKMLQASSASSPCDYPARLLEDIFPKSKSNHRFRECHTQLAKEIMRMGKKFYFVRSKMDSIINAEKRKKSFDQKKTLDTIREDCEKGLRKISVEDPVKYDFSQLQERMERELPQHKRRVLMLALPNIILEINEKKKKALEKNIGKVALLSALVATVPIPGLSIALDVVIVINEIETYYSTFGLDDPSLQKLCERSGKTIEEFKSLMKSPLRCGINPALILSLVGAASLIVAENAVEYAVSLIPILGSLVAGGISYVTVFKMLKRALNDIAEDARNVLLASVQTEL